ncbi:hypothetical protein [Homoserinibacter sp. GY 40078]|uniref:hypothetical protein n=1 Tax=Homoserinibacter sp. GY 40078 TaxID=2603275 RepID=UPI0011C724B1|nr:hypothetical protein [Homoserinibacter sp. GY 40078]TXK18394.1 hypothetical protein FVQ89_00020 [Homoserinibacter sp. GY 40078]
MLPPIRRHILVRADRERAYRVFTAGPGTWWPRENHSIFGRDGVVEFEGDEIVERSPTGSRDVWGRLLFAAPPQTVSFTWHPGQDAEHSIFEVNFTEVADNLTLVCLIHVGWESYEDPDSAGVDYLIGWPGVLDRYAAHANDPDAQLATEDLWLVLSYAHGPNADGAGVTSHPLLAQHAELVREFADEGVLVAAGALIDEPDAGQMVIRVPLEHAAAYLARVEADPSVAERLFLLSVRPWKVWIS